MKPLICLAFLSVSITATVSAQDFYPLKRKPYQLSVAVDKKTTYEENLSESTYLLPDLTLQLYPGESVFIEIEQENGIIKNVRAVEENKHPEKTLIIFFAQSVKKKVHEMMLLKIENPFRFPLSYDAKVYLMQYKKWINTNVVSVPPGLSSIETWTDLLSSIAIADWKFEVNKQLTRL
jgi:hypothetical protein